MQRTRIHTESTSAGVGVSTSVTYTIDETNGVNVHGMRLGFIAEPINADANAHGMWVLWCLPDEISAVPSVTANVLELEGSNAFIWAMGNWSASNETPFTLPEVNLGTSRNCQNGARLVLVIGREGVTAGNVRIQAWMRCFTKSL